MKKILVWLGLLLAISINTSMAKVAPEDFLALYLFEEGSGTTVKDSSGNGNDGSIKGTLDWDKGKYGGGLKFAGKAGNYVEIPNSDSLNPSDQITLAAWAYFEDTASGNHRIMQKSTPGSDNQYRLLLEWGALKFDAGPGVTPKEITAPLPPAKEWHHIAGVYDGKKIALYVDGEEVKSTDASGSMTPTTGPLFIGTKHPGAPDGDCMNGVLDEVVVMKRGLSADEVKELMKGAGKIFTAVEPSGKLAITWASVKLR